MSGKTAILMLTPSSNRRVGYDEDGEIWSVTPSSNRVQLGGGGHLPPPPSNRNMYDCYYINLHLWICSGRNDQKKSYMIKSECMVISVYALEKLRSNSQWPEDLVSKLQFKSGSIQV